VNVLMVARSVINVLRLTKVPRQCRNFGVVSAALLKYYSHHTEVFFKCFNGCAQCN
jgi:hypothetical protein